MGLMSWSWLKKEVLSHKRRESAPPVSAVNYDPNANREQYLQAFDEFKQRGSLYNQLTIREENEDNGSPSTDTASNKATNESEGETIKHKSKSGKTSRHSLPNKIMSRGSPHKKTNTPKNVSVISEVNNNMYVNEILEFEGNCVNDASFGATGRSPPKTFYRNSSNPFSPDTKKAEKLISESTSARKAYTKLEESSQRACGKLLHYIRPNAKKDNSSSSSGAYKPYHLDSIQSDDEELMLKKSNGQDIPIDLYDEICNVLGGVVQHNTSYHQREHQTEKHNSPVKPQFESGIGGINSLSAFTSFKRCEGLVDENFGFLNDTQWNKYLGDENKSYDVSDDQEVNVKITDLDGSSVSSSQYGKSGVYRGSDEALSEIDSLEKWGQNMDSSFSPQAKKHPIYIIECKAKDIKPKTSALRNTIVTPFDFSSGSFRQTTVTLKKCCPRDSASIRLVEEAIERDYEILSQVKHPNIVILMAACFHKKLINHMTLVLEPVDYTLNYYLHQMDRSFTIVESISIVQQIAAAALYLQECGYIHSNISSHNILVRERPWSVKLSSFELATAVDSAAIRAEVEIKYPMWSTSKISNCSATQKVTRPEEDNVSLKEQYMEMSKRPPASKRSSETEHEYRDMPSKYLIYDTIYRQRLSMHNFLAPELLTTDQRFVFPTTRTDVYSLCLLLWEMLNQCVPFAVYSKLDMERMVASKKLNLPFFERQRCRHFMDIFRVGLSVKLENRSIDVAHLIEMLEDIELEILTGGDNTRDDDYNEESSGEDNDVEQVEHGYVNYPQQVQTENIDDTVMSTVSEEPEQLNGNQMHTVNDFILSPSLLNFDKSLSERERTSTKKMRKKPPRKFIKHQIRELFPVVNETPEVEAPKQPSFVDLNESFIEISNDIRRHVFDDIGADEKLNHNLANIAEDIRRNILNDTAKVLSAEHQPKKVYCKVKEPSTEKHTSKLRETTPSVVGFSIKNNKSRDSKAYGNFLEAPVIGTAAESLLNSKVNPSPSGYNFNIQQEPTMPDTPIARQNYIRRNAWLSNQQQSLSTHESEPERTVKGSHKETSPLNDEKKVNVSVRIVHNKITPKKAGGGGHSEEAKPKIVDEGRPSILSKIQFFNSTNETSKTDNSLFCDKHPTKVDAPATNKNSTNYSDKIVNERIVTATSEEYESSDKDIVSRGTTMNERNTIINELKDVMVNLQKSHLDQPHQKQLFENKLWKRELQICNRSLSSSGSGNDSKALTPKFRSVRDTIMKFEKRGEVTRSLSTSQATPTELVKSNASSQQKNKKNSPTLIKRTIYSERILSGVDLSPSDNQMQMFDKFNFGRQKLATRVSVRQVRQTSSDVGVTNRRRISGRTDVRHTICGSEIELLSFNAGTFNSPGVGPPSGVTKYVCFNCASKMSSDELKALTYEAMNTSENSDANALDESLSRRCQARVKTQDTRSIEDLYIDDDFVHGLGANMELQSDSSDFPDFDITSEIFNSKYDAVDHNRN